MTFRYVRFITQRYASRANNPNDGFFPASLNEAHSKYHFFRDESATEQCTLLLCANENIPTLRFLYASTNLRPNLRIMDEMRTKKRLLKKNSLHAAGALFRHLYPDALERIRYPHPVVVGGDDAVAAGVADEGEGGAGKDETSTAECDGFPAGAHLLERHCRGLAAHGPSDIGD